MCPLIAGFLILPAIPPVVNEGHLFQSVLELVNAALVFLSLVSKLLEVVGERRRLEVASAALELFPKPGDLEVALGQQRLEIRLVVVPFRLRLPVLERGVVDVIRACPTQRPPLEQCGDPVVLGLARGAERARIEGRSVL